MLRSLKEVRLDDSIVGFYQATSMGAFYNQSLVDIQSNYQEKLRHGGVVLVHGIFDPFSNQPHLTLTADVKTSPRRVAVALRSAPSACPRSS